MILLSVGMVMSCLYSVREEIAKQKGFVSDLSNYTCQQWVEFFRMKASTAQALVEEIGPFYRQCDGSLELSMNFCLQSSLSYVINSVMGSLFQGEEGHKYIYKSKY